MKTKELLPFWLQENAQTLRTKEKQARRAYDAMADKTTHYACSIAVLADVHAAAAALYEDALETPELDIVTEPEAQGAQL